MMADDGVTTMAPEEQAREWLRGWIWEQLDRDPATTQEPVECDIYLGSGEDIKDFLETLASGEEVDSPPSIEDCAIASEVIIWAREVDDISWDAYDLGDGFFYVVHDNCDERTLFYMVPKDQTAPIFRSIQEEHAAYFTAREHAALNEDEPWFLRAVVKAYQDGYRLHDDLPARLDHDALRWAGEVWNRAVVVEPPAVDGVLPPGFDVPRETATFEAWVEGVTLQWRDTRELLTVGDTFGLRAISQHLAV